MTTGPESTADQLREVFETLASNVQADPDAYQRVQGEWRRRERKRRLILAVVVALVFTLADAAGLWALNQARNQPHIVFNDPAPAVIAHPGRSLATPPIRHAALPEPTPYRFRMHTLRTPGGSTGHAARR